MAASADITPALLRQLIRFEPETGRYYWLPRPREMFRTAPAYGCWNARFSGAETFIGKTPDGYRRAAIFGIYYRAHRLIWAFHTGEWPKGHIDHINGIRDDNRMINLRDVTNAENTRNRRLTEHNQSGQMGVCWNKAEKKWRATISDRGRRVHLGGFKIYEDAVSARKSAEQHFGYHPNHGLTS